MKLHVEPPEKKKRKTKSSSPPPSLPLLSTPSFSLLPEEITVHYLSRISRSYYPRLSIVSKSFYSLLSSNELYAERSHIGNTEECLYVCLTDFKHQNPQWSRLWFNPNQTLANSSVTKTTKKKKTIPQMLVPVPSSNFPAQSKSTAAVVGSEIYVIGGLVHGVPSSTVRILDCRSHTWRDAPSMNVARENAWTCAYDGKIYVIGGCKGDEPWAEVFDTKNQTWEPLPDPGIEIRKCTSCRIVELEGKITFGNYAEIYAYDTNQNKWEICKNKSKTFPKSDCVIENVSYYGDYFECLCKWYDINDGIWKEVKGLDSLVDIYNTNCGSSNSIRELVSCGGKLLLIWEEYMKRRRKLWWLKSWLKNVMELRFGEMLSGLMLCIVSPKHVGSCIVSLSPFE